MGRWVLDLDGVVWRGDRLIPGSDRAVAALLSKGHEVVFCTNHAQSPSSKEAHLERLGVPRCPVATSGESVVAQCGGTGRVLVLGDPTLVSLLVERGVPAEDVFDLEDGAPVADVDAVVVGSTDRWSRSRVGTIADAVRGGARFLATNDDATFPSAGPGGLRTLPGNGALVAAVATAAGAVPVVTGKPHEAMAELLRDRHGPVDVVVGDKPGTDGLLASRLGARFALVFSGVTGPADQPVQPEPWKVAPDLLSLVEQTCGDRA